MWVYPNKYQAQKEKQDGEKVVKVVGGYVLMTVDQYRVWKKQR